VKLERLAGKAGSDWCMRLSVPSGFVLSECCCGYQDANTYSTAAAGTLGINCCLLPRASDCLLIAVEVLWFSSKMPPGNHDLQTVWQLASCVQLW
jgi:hypothetical protein